MMSLLALLVVACAILASLGFKGRVNTVGIDLGTTFSVVGFNYHGKVIIVEDDLGRNVFPSVVFYHPLGDIHAGYKALQFLTHFPQRTIFNSKRFIGRSLQDPDVQKYALSHPFKVVETGEITNNGKIAFLVDSGNFEENRPVKIVYPEEIALEVVKHLMQLTNTFLGHRQVKNVVIAVPAKFNTKQREATAKVFANAGLRVVRMLEEPSAAAIAYQLHKRADIHHILVYDFGGGTLDVSILYVANGSVQVYATDGDDVLGGSDFDNSLYTLVEKKLVEATGHPLLTLEAMMEKAQERIKRADYSRLKTLAETQRTPQVHTEGVDTNLLCMAVPLRAAVERMKKELSNSSIVEFTCLMPDFTEHSLHRAIDAHHEIEGVQTIEHQRKIQNTFYNNVTVTVTKEEFEEHCDHLFRRCMDPVVRLLKDLEMDRDDIDEVVLVGGSTRIPRIKQMLKTYFKKDKLNDQIDPDVTVAYGAASVMD